MAQVLKSHKIRAYDFGKIGEKKLLRIVVSLMFFFSSLLVFQIPFHGITFFIMFELLFCMIMFCKTGLFPKVRPLFWVIIIELLTSATFSFFGELPDAHRKAAVYLTALTLPSFFTASYLEKLIKKDINWVNVVVGSLRAMCVFQMVWCLLQFVCYRIGIDLNKLLFSDLLHLVENASSMKGVVSGFSWHQSSLAPILVVSLFMFNSIWAKLIIIFIATVAGNSTVLIGTGLYFCIMLFDYMIVRHKVRRKTLIIIVFIIFSGLVVGFELGLVNKVIEEIVFIFNRVTGNVHDDSAIGHMRYFWAFPQVMDISTTSQKLFGYGSGCSGYPINVLFNQFPHLEFQNWSVECDIMNTIYSWGIVGFVLYYALLLFNIIKGATINKNYAYLVFIIVIEGITYNVQYDWMILLMCFIYICIKNRIDFFEMMKE